MIEMNERKITDLPLASFLLANGHQLVRTEGPAHRRVFVFAMGDAAIAQFYGGNDQVSARQLFSAYRDLRGLAAQSL
jgi:hypothetical protein